jgi:hypothetical protein
MFSMRLLGVVLVHRDRLHQNNLRCSTRYVEKVSFYVWGVIVRDNCHMTHRVVCVGNKQ